ncbi:hypothetical protein Rhe02_82250 [Rhizocola hellebori]|uniref:Glycosyl transferase family 1 domain-containing protein n=1 Tax=Rhizocola hellebori TaxID=1392758 RepID=A0A8J3QFR5_9ACTN|nr:glycosyltransferase [Rhizocola hellebori]GIH10158.1 hypothetical protein Rhe02_82250 [Rhizocola hellebori]
MIPAISGRVREVLAATSRARELRSRRPPKLTVGARRGSPVVYYLTPDQSSPRGGVRMLYRHVDQLNAAGIDAAVLHSEEGFRCTWFANNTRTVSAPKLTLSPDDVLVVPEFYLLGPDLLPAEPRKIVFNQGAYHTFDHVPFAQTPPGAPYTTLENLVTLLTVSEDSAALLRFTFPDIPVHRARAVLDHQVFHPPGSETRRARRIAFVPRRRRQEREHLLHILRSRGVLEGWELIPIEGYTEAQTAELMRSCPIFLSFSEREGFGLPPAEAMASGCYAIGFTGMGGRDYFDPEYSSPVPDSDILGYAKAVEEAIRRYETEPENLAKAGLVASERIIGRYHESGLREDLLSLYQPLMAR